MFLSTVASDSGSGQGQTSGYFLTLLSSPTESRREIFKRWTGRDYWWENDREKDIEVEQVSKRTVAVEFLCLFFTEFICYAGRSEIRFVMQFYTILPRSVPDM